MEKQQITYWEILMRLSAVFSSQTLKARMEWYDIFKVKGSKNLQPRLLYPAKIPFRFDGEMKFYRASKS